MGQKVSVYHKWKGSNNFGSKTKSLVYERYACDGGNCPEEDMLQGHVQTEMHKTRQINTGQILKIK